MGISRWLKLDLISKARGLGLPVTHVQASSKAPAEAGAVLDRSNRAYRLPRR